MGAGQVFCNKKNKVQSVQILLEADRVGLQKYKAVVSSATKEKNTYNNVKNFAVEVIDQRKEIAIISDISHPDLGALKRAIEYNAQRKVTLLKTNSISDLKNWKWNCKSFCTKRSKCCIYIQFICRICISFRK